MPVQREDFTFHSPADQLVLECTAIYPAQPRGIVQFVHGMAEHKARYFEAMEYLAQRGYATVIHNHRGHGGCRIPGHFGKAGAEGLILDTRRLTDIAKEKFPGLPLYLFGHSMGSLVSRCYLKRYDRELSGLFLCGTPYTAPAAVRAGKALISLKILLHGDTRRDAQINRLVTGAFNRSVPNAASPNQWISANAENVTAFDQDPLCGFCFTLNGFRGLMDLMGEAYSPKGWKLENTGLPVHLLSGAEDPCHGGKASFLKSVRIIESKGYAVTWRLFDGMRHEILNEKEKDAVLAHIAEQLRKMEAR
ncbi:MAG: alpha/beta hydrolase [Clostridiales bacterium]|nr:MAG: alpha/beta hydrolase [Clostridiales bacterium]